MSAGILLHRLRAGEREVLLVHPGGPFWARRDAGAWSVPKGELDGDEEILAAARREFAEELGSPAPETALVHDMGEVRQKNGKLVRAFAIEGELDTSTVVSNTCEIEWPPRSGQRLEIPEVDRAEWFTLAEAAHRINQAQAPFLTRLQQAVEAMEVNR